MPEMLPPIVRIRQRRRVGRPPIDITDDSVAVGVTLPSKQFEALCEQARAAGVSVPEIIRRELKSKK